LNVRLDLGHISSFSLLRESELIMTLSRCKGQLILLRIGR
jgi:hypothetical protein